MLNLLTRLIAALLPALGRIEGKLDRVLFNQQQEERRMETAQETLDRVVREQQETSQTLAGLLTTTQQAVQEFSTWPDRVRQAVEEALANNPGIDLSPLQAVADDMDASQGTMTAAQEALQSAIDANKPPAVEEPEPTGDGDELA